MLKRKISKNQADKLCNSICEYYEVSVRLGSEGN